MVLTLRQGPGAALVRRVWVLQALQMGIPRPELLGRDTVMPRCTAVPCPQLCHAHGYARSPAVPCSRLALRLAQEQLQ